MVKLALVTAALVLAAPPAFAQTLGEAAADSKKSDVNRLVCKREEQIGSRLASKKVCLTVKEWLERAQADREETERIQMGTQTRKGS